MGHVVGVILVFRDLTEQRRSELILQDEREYAANIVDTVREPLLVLSEELRVQSASRSFYQTFQVTPAETEGRLIYDLGNRQWDIPRLRQLLERVLPADSVLQDFEVDHVFPSIGHRVMLLNARRIRREISRARLILLAIEDVTERRRAEQGLRESEEHFRLMVEGVKDHAIILLDLAGRVVTWNEGAKRVLGYEAEEILGRSAAVFFTPEHQQANRLALELPRGGDDRASRRRYLAGAPRTAAASGPAARPRPCSTRPGRCVASSRSCTT